MSATLHSDPSCAPQFGCPTCLRGAVSGVSVAEPRRSTCPLLCCRDRRAVARGGCGSQTPSSRVQTVRGGQNHISALLGAAILVGTPMASFPPGTLALGAAAPTVLAALTRPRSSLTSPPPSCRPLVPHTDAVCLRHLGLSARQPRLMQEAADDSCGSRGAELKGSGRRLVCRPTSPWPYYCLF